MATHVHDPVHLAGPAHHHEMSRSVASVFAGLVAIFVLSLGTDVVMHAVGVFPPRGKPMSDGLFVLATVYRVAWAILGSYITARTAPDRPLRHALILGALGVLLSTAGAAATWSRGPEFGPHWYPLALIATSLPCAWVGGRLGARGVRSAT